MPTYRVEIRRDAQKAIAQLPGDAKRRVLAAIIELERDARPAGSIKLAGEDNAYRIRVGMYRIVYAVFDAVLTVMIVRVAHRREVYR